MKKILVLIGIVVMFMFGGCSKLVYVHPSATTQQTKTDKQKCDYEASMATANIRDGIQSAFKKAELVNRCMEIKGYKATRQ